MKIDWPSSLFILPYFLCTLEDTYDYAHFTEWETEDWKGYTNAQGHLTNK